MSVMRWLKTPSKSFPSSVLALLLAACATAPAGRGVVDDEPTASVSETTATTTATSPVEGELVFIDNVRILPMSNPGDGPIEEGAVLVRGGIIEAVGPDLEAPVQATVIDGHGATLLPGLIDMHVHIWDEVELKAYLSHGVTSVRNMSGMPLHLELAQRVEAGELVGPRLVTTGPILNSPGPNQQVIHQLVSSQEQGYNKRFPK